MSIRLALVDDHPLILDGLESLFRDQEDFEVVARCTSGLEAVDALEKLRPDVLILDLRLPDLTGAQVLERLRERNLPTRAVVLTASADQDEIFEAVRLGARGVVLKEMAPRYLVECVRKVHAGQMWLERINAAHGLERLLRKEAGSLEVAGQLTARELEIVRLVGEGLRNRQIGHRLRISEGTVKVHVHNVYQKLKVDSRIALVQMAEKRGWI